MPTIKKAEMTKKKRTPKLPKLEIGLITGKECPINTNKMDKALKPSKDGIRFTLVADSG